MKANIYNVALGAIGFTSFAAAQNGNDPIILNNRTGLAPVVYDTFSLSYTNSEAQAQSVTIPVTPLPARSNTYLSKPTMSVQCWRDGYPCHNGGQRSQRLVAGFLTATSTTDEPPVETGDIPMNTLPVPSQFGAAHRIPPPEFFSTRPGLHFPGQTNIPAQTDDVTMRLLPVFTASTGKKQYNAPPKPPKTHTMVPGGTRSDDVYSVLPIPTELTDGKQSELPPQQIPPPEFFSTLTDVPLPGETEVNFPGGTRNEDALNVLPIPTEDASNIPTPLPPTEESLVGLRRISSLLHTTDCDRRYCPSKTYTPTHNTPTTLPVTPPTGPATPTSRFAVSPEPGESTFNARAVPIDFWRGPGQPVGPEGEGIKGPIQRHSISSDRCYRHYCPSGKTSVEVMPTTMRMTFTPVVPKRPVVTSFPAVPPNVSTIFG